MSPETDGFRNRVVYWVDLGPTEWGGPQLNKGLRLSKSLAWIWQSKNLKPGFRQAE